MSDAVPDDPPALFADRQRVYPRAVRGRIRTIKWVVLALCLTLYYVVPWIRWDRGPGAPNQAVLVDIQNARLFFFWIEIWPQEVYFLTGMLILGAVGLFAVSSLFGRLWCGFTCPQTVWTDLFMAIERAIQGDRNERMRLDRQPWTSEKIRKKALTHGAWFAIAAATGGAWVMYFNDAPTVVREILTGQASVGVYFFFGLFTATTYLLGGIAREQVCTYMCPWPRFQAAMLDEQTLVVTYRDWRGEPRGKAKAQGVGDCVECRACVHVCPTGIDIRDGQQLECIGCGLCVDACDDVMRKLDRPRGLIDFETLANVEAGRVATAALPPGAPRREIGMAARKPLRMIRPRTLFYGGLIALVLAIMLGAWLMRETVTLTALRDRAPIYVRLSDGGLRNAYTLKLANKTRDAAPLALAVAAPPGVTLSVSERVAADDQGRPLLTLRPDGITQWRVFLTAPPGAQLPASSAVTFRLLDAGDREIARESSVFLAPEP